MSTATATAPIRINAPLEVQQGMQPLLEVKNLQKLFPIKRGFIFSKEVGAVRAVDGVSFSVARGTTMGLVGESGCGKSTLGRCILRLIEPTAGEVIFDGVNLIDLPPKEMREHRRNLQIVFQDPQASLNPRMPVGEIISEPLVIFNEGTNVTRRQRVKELMERVGLNPDSANRYPHEFSGGQKQRIGVARALALNPRLIICDEPVSALDVSIQAQIVNLLQDLQKEMDLTYVFIAHDLAVVRHISDYIAVMYLGKIVEYGRGEEIYLTPKHPYTEALLSAVPVPDPDARKQRILLEGDVPSPANPPPGCRFHTRCWEAFEKDANGNVGSPCATEIPAGRPVSITQAVACHLYDMEGNLARELRHPERHR
ncbi:MAG: dipeptide ABC transporter ATP-binding protein [bacterium]